MIRQLFGILCQTYEVLPRIFKEALENSDDERTDHLVTLPE